MKRTLLLLFMICFVQITQAQKKHSVAIGLGLTKHTYPGEWRGDDMVITNYNENSSILNNNYKFWLGYYFKDRFSARIGYSYFCQTATYRPPKVVHEGGSYMRQVTSVDFMAGYNLLHMAALPRLSGWCFVGASQAFKGDDMQSGGPSRSVNNIYPTLSAMIKYNPLRFVFVELGGTYRYIFNDFHTLSGDLSVGLQL